MKKVFVLRKPPAHRSDTFSSSSLCEQVLALVLKEGNDRSNVCLQLAPPPSLSPPPPPPPPSISAIGARLLPNYEETYLATGWWKTARENFYNPIMAVYLKMSAIKVAPNHSSIDLLCPFFPINSRASV
jgi:hypothetical protein